MTPEKLLEALDRYAVTQGLQLNRDREFVLELMQGLLRNEERYGYRGCPCRLAKNDKDRDRDIICPCAYRDPDIAQFGQCYCGLYVSGEFNAEKRDVQRIPERRPAELR